VLEKKRGLVIIDSELEPYLEGRAKNRAGRR